MILRKPLPRKLAAFFFLVLLAVELLLSCFTFGVSAAEEGYYIDLTTIEEDFSEFKFDDTLYTKQPGAQRQIVYFIESCYSEELSEKDRFYGIYLWVYNPSAEAINTAGNNSVNLSVGGESYDNVPLEYLAHTSNHLFYKFRVTSDWTAKLLDVARAYAEGHDGARAYKVVGVQLQVRNELSKDSGVSKTFTFTGYARGLDESTEEESTLQMSTSGLETIHLDLAHTTYRSDGVRDDWYRDAIHTAYFALPKVYIEEEYGNLKKIKAEWDEYKTKEIFATSSGNALNELKPYIGTDLTNGLDEDLTFRILWEGKDIVDLGTQDLFAFSKGYNDLEEGDVVDFEYTFWDFILKGYSFIYQNYTPLFRLDWLLPIGEGDIENQKPISSATVEEYMQNYTQKYHGELVGGQFSKNLFIDNIDSDRASKYDPDGDHHIVQEIDADVSIDDFYVDSGFWDHIFGDGVTLLEGLKPIEVISSLDEVNGMTVEEFEARYYVENNGGSSGNVLDDVKKILADKKMCVVLFRFAVTDYYSSPAYFDDTDAWYGLSGSKKLTYMNGYVAQETVFLNFDVISLSFMAEGRELKTIGVVADPINVIPSLIPPIVNEELDWLKFIVMLLALLILMTVLGPFISPIINVLLSFVGMGIKSILKLALWLLSLPFKLLGIIFRRR